MTSLGRNRLSGHVMRHMRAAVGRMRSTSIRAVVKVSWRGTMTSNALAGTAPPIEINCFRPGPAVNIKGAASGPLAGLRFAAKDLFDVSGFVTGGGNPSWLVTHEVADTT